jgi:E3 ubiquitin-protein ligase NEDD4
VATINGEQTRTTSVIKKTLNPYWNESFDMYVTPRPHCRYIMLIDSLGG